MSWSNSGYGGGGRGGAGDDWTQPAAAPSGGSWGGAGGGSWGGGGATSSAWSGGGAAAGGEVDGQEKIDALKNGYWADDYNDFFYKNSAGEFVSSEWDDSLGKKGWWKFLWHEGEGWQPEKLAEHLESGGGDSWGKSDDRWQGQDDNKQTFGFEGDISEWAPNLNRDINWHGVTLVRVEKNFYQENPSVSRRSEGEVAAIRRNYDIQVQTVTGSAPVPNPITSFVEASFPDWFQASLLSHFEEPTPIQIQGWPVALQGRDLVGVAETGSGKTLAYLAPMMIHIMAQDELKAGEGPVGIVLAPTRELAIQIDSVAQEFVGASGIQSTCVYGGVPVRDQAWKVQEKNDIIIGTPGRLIHLLNEQHTNLNRVTYVVLDEADEMLTKGFGDQINLILSQVRPDRQMLMFSATWPVVVQELARNHCKEEPVIIRIGGDTLKACRDITQKVIVIEQQDYGDLFDSKMCKLIEALNRSGVADSNGASKALIFCRTKTNVDQVVQGLKDKHGIKAGGMHSDMDQSTRMWSLEEFKQGNLTIMVATNCLGRGHDIKNVKFVINFDAPDTIESYIHRIGRTGRAGEKGHSLTLLTYKDDSLAPDLIKVLESTDQQIPEKLVALSKGSMFESDWSAQQAGNGAGNGDAWGGYNNGASSGQALAWTQ